MNSPKEPEPGPCLGVLKSRLGHKAGRILRIASRESEGYVQGIKVEDFIGG
jgi:hypothetical protein